MSTKLPPKEIADLITSLYKDATNEDQAVRMRQLRNWRRLKLLWEGYQRVWYSEVAHDWRIWDYVEQSNSDQFYYDKQVNVFKAYLESIIAALSITVPGVVCYPDDADNGLDLKTATAGDKIAKLIYRHNDAPLLWLHALFINVTEGMTAFYNYIDEDEDYGTYKTPKYEDQDEQNVVTSCPNCNNQLNSEPVDPNNPPDLNVGPMGMPGMAGQPMSGQPDQQDNDQQNENQEDSEYDPSLDQEMCPYCNTMMLPNIQQQTLTITRLVGYTTSVKSRVCIEVYGGMNVKIPNYARCQDDVGYLINSYEKDYTLVCEEYDHLDGNEILNSIKAGRNVLGGYDQYAMQARLSPQYQGEFPLNVVTCNDIWIRPARYNSLPEEDCKRLKKKYPHGIKAVFINEELAEACDECMDDHWTLLKNPMSDYVHFAPLGQTLTSIQEITNDIISLVLQTIEHGVGQTIADPAVFDFTAYEQTEVLPGSIMPAKMVGSKKLNESIYEFRTATLSGEILPFYQQVQSMGQLTSGALPSLFGGIIEGSNTASEYSMSRAQALQRLQNQWKTFCITWKNVFAKVIPAFMKETEEDIREVEKNDDGTFFNTFIKRAEMEGKIGRVELEASENLPMTQGQIKDVIEKLLLNQNPLIAQILSQPENIPIISEFLGLPDLFTPGEQDVINQYDEIKELLLGPPTPTGDPQVPETPSVEIDPDFDNNNIHFEICRKWIISDQGKQAKIDNPDGYQNVLLHAKAHLSIIQQQAIQEQQQAMGGPNGAGAPPNKPNPNETQEAPITGESNVQVH
jgi:hypothetical protein